MSSSALDNVAKLSQIVNLYEPRFGYVPGAADNTAAVQAAIAAAYGKTLDMPGEVVYARTLNIDDNIHIRWPETADGILRQVGGVNASFITVAYTVVQNPIFENGTIDGNSSANTSGHGVYLPPHAEPDASVTYGFAVTMLRTYVINCAEKCLYVGRNRNYGRLVDAELKRGGTGCMYMTESSDWQGTKGAYAFPISGPALEVVSGAVNLFEGGAAFGAVDAPAIRITTSGSSPTLLHGMVINFNQREGVHIIGEPGTARHQAHQIKGCVFMDNGLAADNTYSHIKLTDTSGTVLAGNSYRWLGTGNRCKYLVEFTGTYSTVEWAGSSWDRVTNVTYGTAVSNAPQFLAGRFEQLQVTGRSLLGGVAGAESLVVEQGVASGDYWSMQGRTGGTGPTLLAAGPGANVPARVSSKGTSAFEILTGSLARRVARFLDTASAVNWFNVAGGATGNPVTVGAASSTDTHVDVLLAPQGANGRVRLGNHSAIGAETVTGYIEIKDAGGTARKIAVVA